jgi:hypothetical protein
MHYGPDIAHRKKAKAGQLPPEAKSQRKTVAGLWGRSLPCIFNKLGVSTEIKATAKVMVDMVSMATVLS